MSNPFIRRPQLWHRPLEVRRQLQALHDGRPSFVLVGDEQGGKSELLGLVVREVHRTGRRVITSTLDAIVWTSETPEDQSTSDHFWRSALHPLGEINEPSIQQLFRAAAERRFSSVTLEPLSRELHATGVTILVQIDNFDALLLSPMRDLRALLSTLRKLAGMARQGIALVLASFRRIDELNRQTEALCAGSPYFNVFEELILEPLSDDGVNSILDLSGGRFSAEDCAFIKRAVGGHPELLWRAAGLMWEAHASAMAQEPRKLWVGRELVFGAGSLLHTTWGRWSVETRHMLLRRVLAELGIAAHRPTGEFPEPRAWQEDLWLSERLCEALGDHASLTRQIARLDSRLAFELPAASVPLRQLASDAVALLRRRGYLERALSLWGTEHWFASHLRRPASMIGGGLLPATMEHLRRTGWIEMPDRLARISHHGWIGPLEPGVGPLEVLWRSTAGVLARWRGAAVATRRFCARSSSRLDYRHCSMVDRACS